MPAMLTTLNLIENTGGRSTTASEARGMREEIDLEFVLALKVSC